MSFAPATLQVLRVRRDQIEKLVADEPVHVATVIPACRVTIPSGLFALESEPESNIKSPWICRRISLPAAGGRGLSEYASGNVWPAGAIADRHIGRFQRGGLVRGSLASRKATIEGIRLTGPSSDSKTGESFG